MRRLMAKAPPISRSPSSRTVEIPAQSVPLATVVREKPRLLRFSGRPVKAHIRVVAVDLGGAVDHIRCRRHDGNMMSVLSTVMFVHAKIDAGQRGLPGDA